MDDLLQTFGDEVGALLRHPLITLALQLLVAYLAILWLAAAYWTFRDLRSRTREPFLPYLAAAGVIVLTPIGFPLALIAYRIVRPPETVAERRTRDLEAYVLRAEVQGPACAACGGAIDDDWMRCPACGTELAVSCHGCGGRIEPDWSVCAWCARDLEPFGHASVDEPPLPVPGDLLVEDLEPVTDAPPPGAIPGWDPDTQPAPVAERAAAAAPTLTHWQELGVRRPVQDDRTRRPPVAALVGGGPDAGRERDLRRPR